MIKRVTGILAIATVSILSTAATAMAQASTTYPPTSVAGESGVAGTGGGTAFTGSSQVPVGTLLMIGLVVVGLAALFVARRRAARFAS
jgi:LPXTG-motif cell wall-anchored protein